MAAAQRAERSGGGWITFAGTMLILAGAFNIIDGIAAIGNSSYLANELLFANLDAWGWFFVVWGVFQIVAGFAVFGGRSWAAIVGVIAAFFNILAQISWAKVYPVWALSAIVVDILVIYALTVYGGQGPRTR
jgi:hypothetical protein